MAVLAIGALCTLILLSPSGAHGIAATRSSGHTRNCHYLHAGHSVGDGETSRGTILSATGISCRRVLKIVKRGYWRVLRIERESGKPTGRFHLGRFRCHWKLEGPNNVKRCAAGRRRFVFL
jgi:hypothetical protein